MENRPGNSPRSLVLPDGPDNLRIYLAGLHESLPSECLVTEEEKARALTFRNRRDGNHFLHSRHLVRTLICRWLAMSPALIQFQTAPSGKPRVIGLPVEVNWSHCRDALAVILSPEQPVGIDLEFCPDESTCNDCAAMSLLPEELEWCQAGHNSEERRLRFIRIWCLKEAVLKASGEGLSRDMKAVRTYPEGETPRPVQLPHAYGQPGDWMTGFPETGIHGLVCAVAMPKSGRPDPGSSLF